MIQMKCRECWEMKNRIWSGAKDPTGRKVYRDENGKRWNGRQCPDCKYAPKNNVPTDGKGLLGDVIEINPLTHRKCRTCDEPLPKSRYFNHLECVYKIVYFDLYEIYGDRSSSYGSV